MDGCSDKGHEISAQMYLLKNTKEIKKMDDVSDDSDVTCFKWEELDDIIERIIGFRAEIDDDAGKYG